MAFPVVATSTTGSSGGNTTSHSVTMPSGISSGDLLFIFFSCNGNPTVTPPAGWSSLYTAEDTGGSLTLRGAGMYKISDGTEGSSQTVTTSASQTSQWMALRVTGHNSGNVPQAATAVTGTSSNPNSGSVTTTGGAKDYLWLTVAHTRRVGSVTSYPTNYTAAATYTTGGTSGTDTGVACGKRDLNAASEDPGAYTMSGSKVWVANTIAVHPAAAAAANRQPFMGMIG